MLRTPASRLRASSTHPGARPVAPSVLGRPARGMPRSRDEACSHQRNTDGMSPRARRPPPSGAIKGPRGSLAGRLGGAEQRSVVVGAHSALQQLTRRGCLSETPTGRAASSPTPPRHEQHRCVPRSGTAPVKPGQRPPRPAPHALPPKRSNRESQGAAGASTPPPSALNTAMWDCCRASSALISACWAANRLRWASSRSS